MKESTMPRKGQAINMLKTRLENQYRAEGVFNDVLQGPMQGAGVPISH